MINGDYNWNKYQSKITVEIHNPFSDYKVDPNFQELNTLFVLSFKNNDDRKAYT